MPRFSCSNSDNIADLIFKMSLLEEVPKQLFATFPNLVVANFTRSGIKRINRYSLNRAVHLKNLYLKSNELQELNADCFYGAAALLDLDLSFNNISSIDRMAFNTLSKLLVLWMSGNKLRSLDSRVFEPLQSIRTIYLNSNELQVIEAGLFVANHKLKNILLHSNHISVIEEGAFRDEKSTESSTALLILSLSNNELTKLNVEKVKIIQLYLTNNTLEAILLSPWVQTLYAENNRISNVTVSDVTNMQLKTLRLANNSITSLESIQLFHSLNELDLSNNYIGPLNITCLTKLVILKELRLQRTFISNLQHGTFAQQQSLKWLDISYNNLDRFDFDILTSSAALQQIFLDGNRLKSLNYEHLKKTFPALVKIGLSENNWNCTYLIQLVRYCNEHSIELFKSQAIQIQTNINGIYCFDDKNPVTNWNNTLHQVQALDPHLNGTTEDSVLQTLLPSMMDDTKRFSENHTDVGNQTSKLDWIIHDFTRNQFTLIIAVLVIVCLILGVNVYFLVKYHRRSCSVERNPYDNRDNSVGMIIE
uniref:toll-like receptor Tollo n=1 Tax=Anopheles coluzzii TaxID=1518534 RepID=UPI0020FF83C5|nr:toll-like receptor Tollo [Anopheles coluzzii]